MTGTHTRTYSSLLCASAHGRRTSHSTTQPLFFYLRNWTQLMTEASSGGLCTLWQLPFSPKPLKENITFSDGYLGSRNDEERSEMRYVLRLAEPSESSNLRTHLALPGIPGSMLVGVSAENPSPPCRLSTRCVADVCAVVIRHVRQPASREKWCCRVACNVTLRVLLPHRLQCDGCGDRSSGT